MVSEGKTLFHLKMAKAQIETGSFRPICDYKKLKRDTSKMFWLAK